MIDLTGSYFPESSLSHLWYAFLLASTLSSVVGFGLTTKALPEFSEQVGFADLSSLTNMAKRGIRWLLFLLGFIVIVISFEGIHIVSVLLLRGQFTFADVESVTELLKAYFGLLLLAPVAGITASILYAQGNTREAASFFSLSFICALIVKLLLIPRFGLSGIPLGTSTYYLLTQVIVFTWLFKKGIRLVDKPFINFGLKMIVLLGTTSLIAMLINTLFPVTNYWIGLGSIVLLGIVYLSISLLVKIEEGDLLLSNANAVRKKISISFRTRL
ncbi:MAG: lipid II flippase MurJ [Chloroflexota bacterium]